MKQMINKLLTFASNRIMPEKPFNRPTVIQLETTTRCNLNCDHCYRSELDFKERDVPIDIVEKALNKFPKAFRVSLIGVGELMMHSHIGEVFRTVKESGKELTITTNGTFTDEALKLPDRILFSVNYLDSFKWENIEEVKEFSDAEITIQTLEMKQNKDEIEDIEGKAREMSVNWSLLDVFSVGEGLWSCHSKVDRNIEAEKCPSPWSGVYVTMDGDIYPCSFIGALNQVDSFVDTFEDSKIEAKPQTFKMGNIEDENVWNNDKYKGLRKTLSESFKGDVGKEEYKSMRDGQGEFPSYCDICPWRYGVAC